jgi:hypothetical protein
MFDDQNRVPIHQDKTDNPVVFTDMGEDIA